MPASRWTGPRRPHFLLPALRGTLFGDTFQGSVAACLVTVTVGAGSAELQDHLAHLASGNPCLHLQPNDYQLLASEH